MSKVNLTLGESKTSVDLTLENKKNTMTWAESDPETWGEANRTWAQPGEFSTRESKSLVSLSLESK